MDKRYVKVAWNDGTSSRYPYIFLRDNCKCPQCFEPKSDQSMVHTIVDVGLNIEAKSANFSEDGQHLKCVWPDGHESEYHVGWLRDNRMPEKEELGKELNKDSLVKDDMILWAGEQMQDKIPSYDCKAVMNDDKSLFDFLYDLYQYGLVMLDDGPIRGNFLFEMADRIGWFHKNCLG